MNHQERVELLATLSRLGVTHYKSLDLEVRLGGQSQQVSQSPEPLSGHTPTPVAPIQNDESTEKLKDLIGTLKLDDASLIDKIFPAGAGL